MNTPFVLLQDDWIQIAPLGDHPHQLGIQRVTADSAAAMANRFNSFRARLGRLFSGVPMFEGHHDTDPDKYPNGRSFAWVMELQNRAADGLWAKMKWTDEGRDLVATGKYKFISPVWNAREIARENGRPVFIPETLLSLALTNLPNLPLPPLANSESHMKTITELLELPNEATPDQICEAVTRLKGEVLTLTNQSSNLRTSETSFRESEQQEGGTDSRRAWEAKSAETIRALENQLTTRNSELTTAQSQFATERSARIELVLANAIEAGRITLAQREDWKSKLEQDFAVAEAALANCAPALNTKSVTRELGNQKSAYDTAATRQLALTSFITEQLSKGLSYDEAWAKAKTDRSDIFANMQSR